MRTDLTNTERGKAPPPFVSLNPCCLSNQFGNSFYYIPIDYIKCQLIDLDIDKLKQNPNIEFIENKYCGVTGEIKSEKAKYYNFILEFKQGGYTLLKGSIHVFYNNGKHNYNDFDIYAFNVALNQFKTDLNILPLNLKILQIEWGYNIAPPIDTNDILNHLHEHRTKMPTNNIDCKAEGKYLQFKHTAYILKLYNKAQHFGLNSNIMRVEIKRTNWSKYRDYGIITLEDFINTPKEMFLTELVNQWQRVVYYEKNSSNSKQWTKYDNSNFWRELRLNKSPKTFSKHFKRLLTLNKKNGNNIQSQISEIIRAKAIELNRGGNVFQLKIA